MVALELHPPPAMDRRATPHNDRRKNARNGRRNSDPHRTWRKAAWLFAAYALYLSLRAMPAAIRRLLHRESA